MKAQARAIRETGEGAAARGGGRVDRAPGWALLLLAAMVIVATGVRAPRLNLRPMHGDEAVQAEKFRELWQGTGYKYDPNEFHGPTLPYLTAASAWLQGGGRFADMDETTLRLGCVAAGIGVVRLTWLVRGRWVRGRPWPEPRSWRSPRPWSFTAGTSSMRCCWCCLRSWRWARRGAGGAAGGSAGRWCAAARWD